MNLKNILIAITLIVTLPMAQAYCSVPEFVLPPVDFSMVPNLNENMTITNIVPATIQDETVAGDEPIFNFLTKDEEVIEVGPQQDELELILNEELTQIGEEAPIDSVIPGSQNKGRFWTKGKILVTTGILLSVGVLFGVLAFAFAGSGSGSGSGDGSGTGGGGGAPDNPQGNGDQPNDNDNPDGGIPPGGGGPIGGGDDPIGPPGEGFVPLPEGHGIPHNPEPSTFILLGLGLLVPFFRRRGL